MELPKAIVTDADGTYVKYNTRVLKSSVEMLNKLKIKGVIAILATGRGLTSIDYIENIQNFDYLIGGNGAFVYDISNKKMLFQKFIKADEANELVRLAESYGLAWMTETSTEIVFSKLVDDKQGFFQRAIVSGYRFIFSDLIVVDIPKLTFLPINHTNDEQYEILKKIFPLTKYTIYKSFQTCTIVHHEISKWNSLKMLLEKIKLKKEDVWAIGDSTNDVEMMQNVGFSIAMGNALKEVKRIANYVTKDVDENGWAQAFIKLGVIND